MRDPSLEALCNIYYFVWRHVIFYMLHDIIFYIPMSIILLKISNVILSRPAADLQPLIAAVMISGLINANPTVYEIKEHRARTAPGDVDEYALETIDQQEVFDILPYHF